MIKEALYFEDLLFRINGLLVYRNILKDEIMMEFCQVAEKLSTDEHKTANGFTSELINSYNRFIYLLIQRAEKKGYRGNIFRQFAIDLFLDDVNEFSVACEKRLSVKEKSLYNITLMDINTLHTLMNFDITNLSENVGLKENLTDYIPINADEGSFIYQIESLDSMEEVMSGLIWYYTNIGAGAVGKSRMLRYDEEKGLVGIVNYDKTVLSDIIGYEEQKAVIKENTEAFINNCTANNVLLVGARGTGKSSCVKALANDYYDKGLRLIEVSKNQISYMPEILSQIVDRGQKFILFMDDLSFENFETEYKYMKSILEGGVEARPDNVLFYATSNRRHIVQELWSDKKALEDNDEIHTTDTANEKLSLSDRFGITVTFPKPNPKEYLDIVIGLAEREGIAISEEFLKEQAMKWELNQKGYSGRTARQFINSVLWELNK